MFKHLLLKMIEPHWEASALIKADAILTHFAKVKIRVWLIVYWLMLKGKENTPLYCYAIMHSLIK